MAFDDLAIAYLETEIDGQKTRLPLNGDRIHRIGRSKSKNTIVVDDTLASREHAIIQRSEIGHFQLTDLNSINGTFVNGNRVSRPVVLRSGDRIRIGTHELFFHQETVPLPPELTAGNTAATSVFRAQKLVTVLVVDIRDFTRIAQRIEAEKLASVISRFFSESGALLRERGAWAQKYIGDAIMAVWVHETFKPSFWELLTIFDAVYQIHRVADSLQGHFGLDTPVHVGAGANTGFASVGNLGSIAAADHTALGDVVNRAFRLESATKDVCCDVLVGEDTLQALGTEFDVTNLFQCHNVTLKGYDEIITAFGARFRDLECFVGHPAKPPDDATRPSTS
jgi:adenylate cyclase